MAADTDAAINTLFDDHAVVRSVGTGELGGMSLVPETSQPYFEEDPDGDDHSLAPSWDLLTGFTGQYGYNGPAMHSSEFIGGGLARHIMSTPGLYTVLYGEDCWYIAHQPERA